MTEAFRIAPPSVVAPFEYTSLIWAMLLGFIVWGDVPGALVLASAGVVIVSGIYVLHDDVAARRRERRAAPPPGI
jgi:drug/metabolite transporter (DMT)-like permease